MDNGHETVSMFNSTCREFKLTTLPLTFVNNLSKLVASPLCISPSTPRVVGLLEKHKGWPISPERTHKENESLLSWDATENEHDRLKGRTYRSSEKPSTGTTTGVNRQRRGRTGGGIGGATTYSRKRTQLCSFLHQEIDRASTLFWTFCFDWLVGQLAFWETAFLRFSSGEIKVAAGLCSAYLLRSERLWVLCLGEDRRKWLTVGVPGARGGLFHNCLMTTADVFLRLLFFSQKMLARIGDLFKIKTS